MTEITSSALRAAEERVVTAKAKLGEMILARDRAKASLEEIQQKRRGFARALVLGNPSDPKSIRAAANARDDAQTVLEEANLLVEEAEKALHEAQGNIFVRKFGHHWESVLELGRRRGDVLEKVANARDAMYAAAAEFVTLGREIYPRAVSAGLVYPYGARGAVPSDVQMFVGGDSQKLAALIVSTMPPDIFRYARDGAAPCTDAIEKERSFWELQELDDPDAGQVTEAAA